MHLWGNRENIVQREKHLLSLHLRERQGKSVISVDKLQFIHFVRECQKLQPMNFLFKPDELFILY